MVFETKNEEINYYFALLLCFTYPQSLHETCQWKILQGPTSYFLGCKLYSKQSPKI